MSRRLARMRSVKAAVRQRGNRIAEHARADLAAHRAEGDARIEVTHGRTDVVVSLVDVAALSIEYGRVASTNSRGRRVGPMQGLYIMTRAARGG
ncbi:hypothetical protein SSP35_03_03100 [Streptomyces sp. NBRC 110611]|uniref:DUF5403 family protein n=1 Tax=Streptomyces sp. NBRC 110611 TaxID=1621259 RepID=UPI00082B213A|nr:DUF5403 family protein [Streptomyces sp. NBRC 110611]GAU66662.1 hypothetical protein SSP35_03_03100 [Streptomyces sp. NBRC 110611]